MENFCLSQENENQRNKLYNVIKGKGAFSRFKDLIQELGITENWYHFKNKAYEQIVREWCEECLKKQAKNQKSNFLTKLHFGWYTSNIIPVRPRVLLAPASCGAGIFIIVVQEIFYFTAYATFKPEGMERHKTYVRVLESKGVKPIFGEFKRKEKFCFACKKYTQSYEEKKTDVNIALKLFQTAIHDLYDTAIIISGDSDLIPAVQAVKETFPAKTVGVVIPIGRRAEALKQATHFHMKMKLKHLETCQLPDRIELDGKVITRPERWK